MQYDYDVLNVGYKVVDVLRKLGLDEYVCTHTTKAVFKLSSKGFEYEVTYYAESEEPYELSKRLKTIKGTRDNSDFINSLNIPTEIFSSDNDLRLGLSEVVLLVEAGVGIPEVNVKYVVLGKVKENQ